MEAAGALLDQGWITEGFADERQSARYRDWARRMVEQYVAGLDPADEPVGVERTVATRTDKIAVSGRIDRLDAPAAAAWRADGTELVVVDYKTGRHCWHVTTRAARWRSRCTRSPPARALRRDCRRVELHHLPSGQVLAWEHTDETLARHCAGPRRSPPSAPRRTSGCAACCPRGIRRGVPAAARARLRLVRLPAACPEGQAAAVQRRPWDALADT